MEAAAPRPLEPLRPQQRAPAQEPHGEALRGLGWVSQPQSDRYRAVA
jgi:hypothetical protein